MKKIVPAGMKMTCFIKLLFFILKIRSNGLKHGDYLSYLVMMIIIIETSKFVKETST